MANTSHASPKSSPSRSSSGGWRRSPRQAKKPKEFFSEKAQQVRNDTFRKQLEDELPIQLNTKRRHAVSESGHSIPKKQKPPPPPEPLDVEVFLADLSTDYSRGWKKAQAKPKKPAKRQWGPVATPILKREKAPKGWTENEPDLDPEDIPAQIARCKERIAEKIMPYVYEHKLEDLLELQKGKLEIMAAAPGLSWNVARRLSSLRMMLVGLQRDKDEFHLTSNVRAIITAYESRSLDWCDGLVTYWNEGVQLCKPRPFRVDEFRYLHDEHDGLNTGFHVEGLFGLGSANQAAAYLELMRYPNDGTNNWWHSFIEAKHCLRIPLSDRREAQPLEFSMIDDTGASLMQIWASDVTRLMGMNPNRAEEGPYPMPRIFGCSTLALADSSVVTILIRELEVNLLNPDTGEYMFDYWETIPVTIQPGHCIQNGTRRVRLNGPWMRWRFWTATVPNHPRLGVYDYNPSHPPHENGFTIDDPPENHMYTPFPVGYGYDTIANHPELDPNLPAGRH